MKALLCLAIALVGTMAWQTIPSVYEASCDVAYWQGTTRLPGELDFETFSGSYEEVLNTRAGDWRSEKVGYMARDRYLMQVGPAKASDDMLRRAFDSMRLERVGHDRIFRIMVTSPDAHLAASYANAYARAIIDFTESEEAVRCERRSLRFPKRSIINNAWWNAFPKGCVGRLPLIRTEPDYTKKKWRGVDEG